MDLIGYLSMFFGCISLPHEAQEEALATIKYAPEVGMFAAPYNSAGLAIHGLL